MSRLDQLKLGLETDREEPISIELSEDEKRALRQQAMEQYKKELMQSMRRDFLNEELDRIRVRARRTEDPLADEIALITIDLPGSADRVRLDNKVYFHGHTYEFDRDQAACVREVMARAWRHEAEIGGAYRDHYRKPSPMVITPSNPGGIRAGF